MPGPLRQNEQDCRANKALGDELGDEVAITKLTPGEVFREGEVIEDASLGIKVRYRPEHLSLAQAERIKSGGYEKTEVVAISKCLSGGERVLELGGGIGYISSVICTTKSPLSYDVVEANPNLIPMIKETHQLNSVTIANVHHCIATSDRDALERGYMDFNIGESFLASSVHQIRRIKSSVKVPVKDLQELLQDARPDVLIADIEGSEVGLLNGVDVSCLRLVIFELHPAIVGAKAIRALFDEMSRQGFSYSTTGSHGAVVVFRRVANARTKKTIAQRVVRKARSLLRGR